MVGSLNNLTDCDEFFLCSVIMTEKNGRTVDVT